MSSQEIASALLAAHNIARALGQLSFAVSIIAVALVVYPWLGGFGSGTQRDDR